MRMVWASTSASAQGLNESPSEKEGKFLKQQTQTTRKETPSMKVPPKRKGNLLHSLCHADTPTLNESPSEKEGKSCHTSCTP